MAINKAGADGVPGTSLASNFYMACREGNVEKVSRFLKTMTIREINKVEESNGSTALHAATYFGHTEVVKLLLNIGANIHTRNGYGNLPEQEATKPEIKALYEQHKKKPN